MIEVVFAEDDESKRLNVESFLSKMELGLRIVGSRSVRSTIDLLRAREPQILLLDMSLPTFDISREESGGRPQSAGGIEVLDFMCHADLDVATVIITQHEAFDYNGGTISVNDLKLRLAERYRGKFTALIQYNTISGFWRRDLLSALSAIVGSPK
jgi:DNA-binding NarL/FixJ family response regulator